MTSTFRSAATLTAWLAMMGAASAQQGAAPADTTPGSPKAAATDDSTPPPPATEENAADSAWKKGRPITMQYYRPVDKRGLNVFETTKTPGVEFTGFKLDFGAAFTSQLQDLSHSNTASANVANGVNANQLANIGFGFNNPTANLYVNTQLAPGIRVAMTSYLSSRHHNETWVKDGYIQIDQSPIDVALFKALMEIVTIRVGDFEINYGDAHFRRSDNGNAVYNPFVGNYILDAFTTQIGGEVYLKTGGVVAMGSITAGELRGTVLTPGQRGPTYIGKLGIDRQLKSDLRVRLTGSMYKTDRAMSDTLYGGDRAGSRYYFVLENTAATESAQKDSGMLNPGFKNRVTAFQMNPFVKYRGLELFGVVERAQGKVSTEVNERVWNQYALDTVYRFLGDDQLFVGARFNRASGEMLGLTQTVGANRWQLSGGWFVTPNVMAKAEYVKQTYFGYPTTDIKNGGRFNGMMLEGVIGF
ncbi:MAG TPA: hypothetical protein VL309_11935 [Vicinamibacterales bacterium]|jgi:hypothetical protein|nr:hypothetical protein [Vicinamibacterales bacterium]